MSRQNRRVRQQRTFCLKNSRIRLYISGGVNYNVSATDFCLYIVLELYLQKTKKNHVILKFEQDSSILIIYKYNLF